MGTSTSASVEKSLEFLSPTESPTQCLRLGMLCSPASNLGDNKGGGGTKFLSGELIRIREAAEEMMNMNCWQPVSVAGLPLNGGWRWKGSREINGATFGQLFIHPLEQRLLTASQKSVL